MKNQKKLIKNICKSENIDTKKISPNYILNIIDTPGHVDFSYEVSRSLYACEGSILIVDSTQGVEAQTLANVYQALDTNHEIVPVLNKVDLAASDLDRTKKQIEEVRCKSRVYFTQIYFSSNCN